MKGDYAWLNRRLHSKMIFDIAWDVQFDGQCQNDNFIWSFDSMLRRRNSSLPASINQKLLNCTAAAVPCWNCNFEFNWSTMSAITSFPLSWLSLKSTDSTNQFAVQFKTHRPHETGKINNLLFIILSPTISARETISPWRIATDEHFTNIFNWLNQPESRKLIWLN